VISPSVGGDSLDEDAWDSVSREGGIDIVFEIFDILGENDTEWKETIQGITPWVYTYFHDSSRGSADERERVGERDEWKFGQGVQG
jgi:hypothetical protein